MRPRPTDFAGVCRNRTDSAPPAHRACTAPALAAPLAVRPVAPPPRLGGLRALPPALSADDCLGRSQFFALAAAALRKEQPAFRPAHHLV